MLASGFIQKPEFGSKHGRVSDPHWFNADTDPDPTFFLIADPDPGFDYLKLKKIAAGKKINFFLDQKLQFSYP